MTPAWPVVTHSGVAGALCVRDVLSTTIRVYNAVVAFVAIVPVFAVVRPAKRAKVGSVHLASMPLLTHSRVGQHV